jgi:hypothetical protein
MWKNYKKRMPSRSTRGVELLMWKNYKKRMPSRSTRGVEKERTGQK